MLKDLLDNEDVRNILKQFPQEEWPRILKPLLVYGGKQLQKNYDIRQLKLKTIEDIAYDRPEHDMSNYQPYNLQQNQDPYYWPQASRPLYPPQTFGKTPYLQPGIDIIAQELNAIRDQIRDLESKVDNQDYYELRPQLNWDEGDDLRFKRQTNWFPNKNHLEESYERGYSPPKLNEQHTDSYWRSLSAKKRKKIINQSIYPSWWYSAPTRKQGRSKSPHKKDLSKKCQRRDLAFSETAKKCYMQNKEASRYSPVRMLFDHNEFSKANTLRKPDPVTEQRVGKVKGDEKDTVEYVAYQDRPSLEAQIIEKDKGNTVSEDIPNFGQNLNRKQLRQSTPVFQPGNLATLNSETGQPPTEGQPLKRESGTSKA